MVPVCRDYPCDPRNYQKGRARPIAFLVLHYVGATGTARANARYYGGNDVGASAHFFVGHESEGAVVYQSVAEGDVAWHCGRSDGKYKHPTCRNANSIGIELCCHQRPDGTWYIDPETVIRGVELAREIMARHGIPVANVLRHYDVTGKPCPRPWVDSPAEWAAFKTRLEELDMAREELEQYVDQRVARALADYEEEVGANLNRPVSPWAAPSWEKATAAGILDGTRPNAPLTREQYAVTLDRLGLLERGAN